jgi:hypothetical protein
LTVFVKNFSELFNKLFFCLDPVIVTMAMQLKKIIKEIGGNHVAIITHIYKMPSNIISIGENFAKLTIPSSRVGKPNPPLLCRRF